MGAGTAALIVAAGRGSRLRAERPKQYLDLGGRSILARSIGQFLALKDISHIQVVIAEGDEDLYREALGGLSDSRLLVPATGGASRSASVRNGLDALASVAPDRVLIHDAARPFVPARVIAGVIAALETNDGAFAALPVVDALWHAEGKTANHPVDRTNLWRAQTPQGFRFDMIRAAHASGADAADDVEVARIAGMDVQIVMGEEINFKITTQADLVRARDIIAAT